MKAISKIRGLSWKEAIKVTQCYLKCFCSFLDHFTNNWDKTVFATATIAQQAELAKDETAIR